MLISGGKVIAIDEINHDNTLSGDGLFNPLGVNIDAIGKPLTYSGSKSVADINELDNIKVGTVYTISGEPGTITAGNFDVIQGDEIAWGGEPAQWFNIGKDKVDLSNYYLKTQTSGKQEISDALDLKQNTWSSAAISTLTTSYDIANNTVTKLENNNISDILEFNITGLSADEVPNVSIEFINNQAECYPVFKNGNVELLCNTDTCYSGKSYMFRALGSMSEIIEMRQPQPNVSVNGNVVSVNGNLITP